MITVAEIQRIRAADTRDWQSNSDVVTNTQIEVDYKGHKFMLPVSLANDLKMIYATDEEIASELSAILEMELNERLKHEAS